MESGLGGDGVVAFQGFVDIVGGDGAFAADAPEVAAKFDDGGGQGVFRFAAIEDEGNAIAELAENFVATFAGRRAGKIGAGAGERDTEFANEVGDDFAIGPTESDAAGIGGDFEGKAVGGVDDDGEWAGPTGLGEAEEVVRQILGEYLGVDQRVDEDGKGLGFGAALNTKNFFDGGEVYGIGSESVERIGRKCNDRAAI